MKKLAFLGLFVISAFLLASCNTTSASGTIDVTDITKETVTATATVDDPDSVITGSVYLKIYDSDDEVQGSQELTFDDDETSLEQEVTLTALEYDTDYTLKIIATIGTKNVTLASEDISTYADTQVTITTAEEFLDMNSNRSGDYILANDIDFADVDFSTPFPSGKNFSGTFDGQGYTLSNITITDVETYTGVFGYISSGEVTNLNLDNVTIGTESDPLVTTASSRVGILSGYISSDSGIIDNVNITNSNIYYTSESTLTTYAGGAVGESRGALSNVSVENTNIYVESTSYANTKIGGVVGYLYSGASITESYSTGSIEFVLNGNDFGDEDDSYINIGGVIGRNDTLSEMMAVTDIYSTMDIAATIAYNTLEETTVASYSLNIGGLIGLSSSSIYNGFYAGSITLDQTTTTYETATYKLFNVGGLIGSNYAGVESKYLVRVGNGENVVINVSDDVNIHFSQLFSYNRHVLDNIFGVTGPQTASINGVAVTDVVNEITDLDTAFDSDWITTAFNAIYAG